MSQAAGIAHDRVADVRPGRMAQAQDLPPESSYPGRMPGAETVPGFTLAR